jgi:hypothetical protein
MTIPLIFLVITKMCKLTFHDFIEANVSVKSVDSIPVLWVCWGDHPGHSLSTLAQSLL